MQGAIAVFVKSIGLSPVKTRLGKGIGQSMAERFYQLSCESMHSVVNCFLNNAEGVPYWAVAEESWENCIQAPLWERWSVISQGQGGLGARLHHVYSNLQDRYGSVILVGADCPQMNPAVFKEAFDRLKFADFVCGAAEDGGFYLFAGKRVISSTIWESTEYSHSETLKELSSRLELCGVVETDSLPILRDVDEFSDFKQLLGALNENHSLSSEQLALKKWLFQEGYKL